MAEKKDEQERRATATAERADEVEARASAGARSERDMTTPEAPVVEEARPLATKDEDRRNDRAFGVPVPQTVERREGGLTGTFDVVGGNIKETVNQPLDALPRDANRRQRLLLRAARAKGTQTVAAIVGRPIDEWGLVGQGDTVIGHFVLIDLDTLEKVEVIDRWQIDQDRVFANSQQWPKALVHGDGLEQLAKGK